MLLDTSILISTLRGHAEAQQFLAALNAKPSISVITLMELLAGARSRREEETIERMANRLRHLPVTQAIAERAGAHLKHYRDSHNVEAPDALIAATAEHHGLELATLNVKHFPMIKGLKAAYQSQ